MYKQRLIKVFLGDVVVAWHRRYGRPILAICHSDTDVDNDD